MRKGLFILFLVINCLRGNTANLDSLYQILDSDIHDTNRIKTLISVGEAIYMGKQDSAINYWSQGISLCDQLLKQNPKDTFASVSKAALVSNIGIIYYYRGQIDTVLQLWEYAAKLEADVGYEKGTIGTYNNMSQIELTRGNTKNAINYLEKALATSYKLNDYVHVVKIKGNIAHCYFLLGAIKKSILLYEEANKILFEKGLQNEHEELIAYNYGGLYSVYLKTGEYQKAKEFLLAEREIYQSKELKRKLYETYNNEGQIENQLGNIKKSIKLYEKAYTGFKKLEYLRGQGVSLMNLAACYNTLENYKKALKINKKSLRLHEEINFPSGIQSNYHAFAGSYLGLNLLDSAEYYALKAYNMGISIDHLQYKSQIAHTLFLIYEKKGEFENALKYHKVFKEMSDSLLNDDIKNEIIKSEFEFEYESKTIQNKKEQEKREAIAAEKDLRQKIIIIGVILVLILVAISAIIIYNRLKITRKQNTIIHQQKKQVEQKNNEILSSINYAKRIQEAILPQQKLIEKHLPNSFFLYLPKDIVSGDFYWVQPTKSQVLFSAVDCTGHGVPGAFMSIVGNNGLNKAIKEEQLTQPCKILDSLNTHVVESLQKEGDTNIKDGMDLALCSLDLDQMMLEYAGAYNPLYIVRNGELMETKADKQAIGLANQPYTNHQFQLQKGDMVYVFTDGYADQFGGPKGKKFTYRRFRELFIEIHTLPVDEQQQVLFHRFMEWKNDEEQIDDVCVIGVKV